MKYDLKGSKATAAILVPWVNAEGLDEWGYICLCIFSCSQFNLQEDTGKATGVSKLIEVENPNHVVDKSHKVGALDVEAKPELTRRERYYLILFNFPPLLILHREGATFTRNSLLSTRCMKKWRGQNWDSAFFWKIPWFGNLHYTISTILLLSAKIY